MSDASWRESAVIFLKSLKSWRDSSGLVSFQNEHAERADFTSLNRPARRTLLGDVSQALPFTWQDGRYINDSSIPAHVCFFVSGSKDGRASWSVTDVHQDLCRETVRY